MTDWVILPESILMLSFTCYHCLNSRKNLRMKGTSSKGLTWQIYFLSSFTCKQTYAMIRDTPLLPDFELYRNWGQRSANYFSLSLITSQVPAFGFLFDFSNLSPINFLLTLLCLRYLAPPWLWKALLSLVISQSLQRSIHEGSWVCVCSFWGLLCCEGCAVVNM